MLAECITCRRTYDSITESSHCPHVSLMVSDEQATPVEISRNVLDSGVVETVQAIPSRTKDNKHPEGYDVVRWPEFIAFAKRLGINLALPFRDLMINIPFEGRCVEITQTYVADDINQPDAKMPFDDQVRPLDVTTAHNQYSRTYVAKPDYDQPDRAPDEIWGSLSFTNLNIGDSWAKFVDTDGVTRFRIYRAKKPN
jgi:hypothetical protein